MQGQRASKFTTDTTLSGIIEASGLQKHISFLIIVI